MCVIPFPRRLLRPPSSAQPQFELARRLKALSSLQDEEAAREELSAALKAKADSEGSILVDEVGASGCAAVHAGLSASPQAPGTLERRPGCWPPQMLCRLAGVRRPVEPRPGFLCVLLQFKKVLVSVGWAKRLIDEKVELLAKEGKIKVEEFLKI
jgi:hypothetical protein